MDNLHVLRAMNSDSVDLIYLDPPFNSNQDYSAPIGSKAAGTAFKDAWTLSDVDLLEHNRLKVENETLYALTYAAGKAHSKGMFSYLMMMAPRLVEMHRVLKPTGSLYLHCDPAANHYLKVLLDALFGSDQHGGEVIWRRTGSHNSRKSFGRLHDTILCYHKTKRYRFNIVRTPYMKGHVKRRYTIGPDGRARFTSGGNVLTGKGASGGPSCTPWRGFDPASKGRHWAIPRFYEREMDDDYLTLSPIQKLEALYKKGLVLIKEGNAWPIMVRYLEERDGVPLGDIWAHQPYTEGTVWNSKHGIDRDVQWLGPTDPERTGYPTQKPLGLLSRIIRTSTNEGDLVLDPFCGCATTLVAAELLNRKWAGVDLSPLAAELVVQRIKEKRNLFRFKDIHHRTSIPIRTDIERRLVSTPKERRELKNLLFLQQEQLCNLCHHEFPEVRHFEMDHIFPRAKGGQDWEDNFQLLCKDCNGTKGTGTQEEARARLVKKRGIDFTPFENGGVEVKRTASLDSNEEQVAKKVLARLMESGSLDELTEAVMGRVAEKGSQYGSN